MNSAAQGFLPFTEEMDLAGTATAAKRLYSSSGSYRSQLSAKVEAIGELQRKLAAARRESMLIVIEGLDAAGKDGSIRRIFAGCDPQRCRFTAGDEPGDVERRHDFLWRFNRGLPQRGELGIFNRSHYGDVVIPRVHPEVLAGPEVPDKAFWLARYRSIRDWEEHLARNGTHIVKIFLHISHAEQQRRLLKRIECADKSWKIEIEDVRDHHRFAEYVRCFGECMAQTHADAAPWFIVPADDKKNARLLIADIVLQRLRAIDPTYPSVSKKRAADLKRMRSALLEKPAE